MNEQNLAIAGLLVRVIAGVLFFFQGYDKLFNIKIEEVTNTFMRDAERRHIPRYAVVFISYLTSIIELTAGALLIIGFYTVFANVALCLNMVIITFAFSMMQPVWDMKHVFPRLVLLLLLLLLPQGSQQYSLDQLLNH